MPSEPAAWVLISALPSAKLCVTMERSLDLCASFPSSGKWGQ